MNDSDILGFFFSAMLEFFKFDKVKTVKREGRVEQSFYHASGRLSLRCNATRFEDQGASIVSIFIFLDDRKVIWQFALLGDYDISRNDIVEFVGKAVIQNLRGGHFIGGRGPSSSRDDEHALQYANTVSGGFSSFVGHEEGYDVDKLEGNGLIFSTRYQGGLTMHGRCLVGLPV